MNDDASKLNYSKNINTEICSKCGSEFSCNAANISQCHCSQIILSPDVLKLIAEKWSGCLCAKCLQSLSQKSEGPPI